MARWQTKEESRERRHLRLRKRVAGSTERPRLAVRRSLTQIYAQIVDDTTGRTLAAVSSLAKDVRARFGEAKTKTDQSRVVGRVLAERAKSAGITRVAFDRGGYIYHGRIKALADGAREGGLDF
jgi:large subunit ribosomal protein L18